jgi:hypothetical protein
MSIPENERAAMAVLVSNLLVQQAIEVRARTPESVWLAHSFEEAEANANLFAKTQLPITDPERKRSLIRAFDRVKKSRETYSTRSTV